MNYELAEALGQLIREKSLDKKLVTETLEAGLLSAAKKKLGPSADIGVSVDMDEGKIEMWVNKKVSARVHDPAVEISLADAHKIKKDARSGDVVPVHLSIEEFGRNAIQAVKQVLVQRVREAERERIYNEFQGRIGEIIRGTVQQVDRNHVIVKLERTEGVLPVKETMPRDRFRHGEYVRCCVIGVDKSTKGPQVTLSRTHPDFLKGLFASEVPEVAEGIVEIRNVAREAGNRSKICVISNDEKVDAVGACVGVKGSRVQAVVRELGGERIDIVPWSSDTVIFVTRSLSPAKVLEARIFEKERRTEVVVADDQLSLAIGKGGQNARLAARLTGWKIDLMSLSQKEKLLAEEKALRVDVENIDGIGPKLAEKLLRAGIETAQDIEKYGLKGLQEIQGIGEKTAGKLVALAADAMERVKQQLAAEKAKALEEKATEPEAEAAQPESGQDETSSAGAPSETQPAGEAVEETQPESESELESEEEALSSRQSAPSHTPAEVEEAEETEGPEETEETQEPEEPEEEEEEESGEPEETKEPRETKEIRGSSQEDDGESNGDSIGSRSHSVEKNLESDEKNRESTEG